MWNKVKKKKKTYHSDEASHESEVEKMVRIYFGGGVDLQGVVGTSSVLEQAIHGIKYFVRY